MMKYFLFDLAVITAIAGIAGQCFAPSWMRQECPASGNIIGLSLSSNSCWQEKQLNSIPAADNNHRNSYASKDYNKSRKTIPQDESNIGNSDDSKHLRVGGLVELYGESSYFAAPAIIRGGTKEKYNLVNFITNSLPTGVASEFIHPYKIYDKGTFATCNVGVSKEIHLTPCTVVSHLIQKSGSVYYEVSYSNKHGELFPKHLPFSKIQRYRSDRSGRGSGEGRERAVVQLQQQQTIEGRL